MKKILFLLFLQIFAFAFVNAQSTEKTEEPDYSEVFIKADTMPEYPGGMSELYHFIAMNLNYPKTAREKNIQGKVFVQFVVQKDGSLDEFVIIKGIGGGCDEEVIRVLKLSSKWNPGIHNGQNVKIRMNMPVTFRWN